ATQFYYLDSSCTSPFYGLEASGVVKLDKNRVNSGMLPWEQNNYELFMSPLLYQVTVLPYTSEAAVYLQSRVSSVCRYRFGRNREVWRADGVPRDILVYVEYKKSVLMDFDCTEKLGFNLNEFLLLRIEESVESSASGDATAAAAASARKRRQLHLGEIATNMKQRRRHRPSGFQPPLEDANNDPCPGCYPVLHASLKTPPILLLQTLLPDYPTGEWVSSVCESRPRNTYVTRRLVFDNDAEQQWTGTYNNFHDPLCKRPFFSFTATGRVISRDIDEHNPDARQFDFLITGLSITPRDQRSLNQMNTYIGYGCGRTSWRINRTQDVTNTNGCDHLRLHVPTKSEQCARVSNKDGDTILAKAKFLTSGLRICLGCLVPGIREDLLRRCGLVLLVADEQLLGEQHLVALEAFQTRLDVSQLGSDGQPMNHMSSQTLGKHSCTLAMAVFTMRLIMEGGNRLLTLSLLRHCMNALQDTISPEELKRTRDRFEREFRSGQPVSTPTQLAYAGALTRTSDHRCLRQACQLLETLYRQTTDEIARRDCLYYLSIAKARLKDYDEALTYIDGILKVEPSNAQARKLKLDIEAERRREGFIGLALLGGISLLLFAFESLTKGSRGSADDSLNDGEGGSRKMRLERMMMQSGAAPNRASQGALQGQVANERHAAGRIRGAGVSQQTVDETPSACLHRLWQYDSARMMWPASWSRRRRSRSLGRTRPARRYKAALLTRPLARGAQQASVRRRINLLLKRLRQGPGLGVVQQDGLDHRLDQRRLLADCPHAKGSPGKPVATPQLLADAGNQTAEEDKLLTTRKSSVACPSAPRHKIAASMSSGSQSTTVFCVLTARPTLAATATSLSSCRWAPSTVEDSRAAR
uniref:TPR_REGION domain-containing protein n=1 Tax=Macrostomum lignano TaxID=282301 RepID=A0A1I8I098_9PLAT